MGDKEDYLTSYRVFFENFAATVNPEDQLPVYAPDYSITEAELPGDVIYWCIEYLREKSCPATLLTPLLRMILDEVRTASKKYPNEFGFDAEKSVYRAIWLMQAVIARVNDVCLRYLDNAKLDTLPPPPPPSQKEFRSVSAAMRNSRRVMEDRHVEISNLEALFGIETTEHTSFYAVYDGHAGSSAAQYCVAHLHQYLVESPHFKKNLRQALHDAFLRTDAEFIRKSNMEHRVIGGSTAVVICIRGKRMLVAWAGDSLALVAQRMRVMQLVHPHKPDREDERERIELAGGTVIHWGTWRVDGQLAVSRAIGDAQYKPYVTAKPELGALDLDGDEDFLVVACDGLWDVVSEDEVALAVYRQIAADPNDLKAVTKRLIVHAKREGSEDNISIIVVFLKDPRDIAAQNCPPMDLGLDNAVVNAPPFAIEGDAGKVTATVAEAAGGDCATADNGVSDSDSEDLGPETAVDVDADDGDVEMRSHDPAPPTPPAHSVEESHIDGNLVDNVAESGEESEDEWNYYKGEGEPEQNPSEEADEPPRSETPCQDNSAWESSSVDMNSSPLNPDAPVFVPGGVAGSDVLLAESPRKPLPMEDIIVPDVKQFETEAGGRPAELQDLDNCDHLNGHHNISIEGITAHLNGNNKCEMDSFKFNVGIESDKIKDSSLIQDFERIQKDTTDFCNIQVFQAHSETNPFGMDNNDELFERLKNKERDPMSMSFYQEKDDDTCERFSKLESQVDLNSVQPLPDSDDEDMQPNGDGEIVMEDDKENISPEHHVNPFSQINNGEEPNNDIMRFDDRTDITANNVESVENIIDCNVDSNNMQNYSNIEFECNIQQDNVAPTDTPESHKLLFEQIPEIPDGKSSELGFNNDDLLEPSESDKDARAITPQDDDLSQQDEGIENNLETSKYNETQPEITLESKDQIESTFIEHTSVIDKDNEIVPESNIHLSHTPEPTETTSFDQFQSENSFVNESNTIVDVHQSEKQASEFEIEIERSEPGLMSNCNGLSDEPKITLESDEVPIHEIVLPKSPGPVENETQSPLPELEQPEEFPDEESLLLKEASLPRDSPLPNDLLAKSPLPSEVISEGLQFAESPVPSQSPLPTQSPLPSIEAHSPIPTEEKPTVPAEVPLPRESPAPSESPFPEERVCQQSPHLVEESIQRESPLKEEFISESVTRESPLPIEESVSRESPCVEEVVPKESPIPAEESALSESPVPVEETVLSESPLPVEHCLHVDEITQKESPLPPDEFVSSASPLLMDKVAPMETTEDVITKESPLHLEESVSRDSPLPDAQSLLANSPHPIENSIPYEAPLHMKEESVLCETTFPEESPRHTPVEHVQNESLLGNVQIESPIPVESQECIEDVSIPEKELQTSAPSQEISLESQYQKSERVDVLSENAPAPDIVSEHTRSELITDIDIGIPESRAQEICVPVMSEIQNDVEMIRPATTPPPTPAIEPTSEPPLSEVPIAPAVPVAAAVLAGAAVATATAAAAKSKASPAKKSPTTPTPRPKTAPKAPTPGKTPTSATKRPTSTTTPRTAPTKPAAPKTPISATKAAKPSPKPASPTKAAPKPLAPVKEAPATAKAAPARPTSAPRPATKPAAPKPPTTAKTTGVAKTTTTTVPRVPATKPAPRPISAKPSAPAKTTAAPVTARNGISATTKPKAPERKPLTNGDVKPAAAKPAPRPAAPAARPAPRPAPRAPAAAPAKPASAKPPVRAPLDKQSKDLANKRITAKTAPPRTVPAKSTVANNAKYAMKSVPKRSDAMKKEALANGPPPADAALPDVIA